MNRPQVSSIAIDAFYDNFTCAALFQKLRVPGAPEAIIDPRTVHSFWADEFQQICADARAMIRVAVRLGLIGFSISVFFANIFNRQNTKVADPESFLADWSSYIKP
jgi:hypothetical protein